MTPRIRLFMAHLDGDEATVRRCDALLSDDEHARAAAFAFPWLRRRFVMARAFLRSTLGQAANQDPALLRFAYGPMGKPDLPLVHPLRFNLSHSDDLALLALCDDGEVGVDLEHRRPLPDLDALCQSQFCPSEQAALCALSPAERPVAFFRVWARKEAVLKALGTGFSLPATAVEVTTGLMARLTSLSGDEAAAAPFLLIDVDADKRCAAALAMPTGAHLGLGPAPPPLQLWCPP